MSGCFSTVCKKNRWSKRVIDSRGFSLFSVPFKLYVFLLYYPCLIYGVNRIIVSLTITFLHFSVFSPSFIFLPQCKFNRFARKANHTPSSSSPSSARETLVVCLARPLATASENFTTRLSFPRPDHFCICAKFIRSHGRPSSFSHRLCFHRTSTDIWVHMGYDPVLKCKTQPRPQLLSDNPSASNWT